MSERVLSIERLKYHGQQVFYGDSTFETLGDNSTRSLIQKNIITIADLKNICTENQVEYDNKINFITSDIKGYFAYKDQVYETIPYETLKEPHAIFKIELTPETNNVHDDLAIRIDILWEDKLVTMGYIPRGSNSILDMSQKIKGVVLYEEKMVVFPNPKDIEYLLLQKETANLKEPPKTKVRL